MEDLVHYVHTLSAVLTRAVSISIYIAVIRYENTVK